MFCDVTWLSFTALLTSIYTDLPVHSTMMIGTLPFLFMTLFSTTFSPGSGLDVVSDLRYLFPRYYFWCMLPDVQDSMEGCPTDESMTVVYLVLSTILPFLIFGLANGISRSIRTRKTRRPTLNSTTPSQERSPADEEDDGSEIQNLRTELFGAGWSSNGIKLVLEDGTNYSTSLTTDSAAGSIGKRSSHEDLTQPDFRNV